MNSLSEKITLGIKNEMFAKLKKTIKAISENKEIGWEL